MGPEVQQIRDVGFLSRYVSSLSYEFHIHKNSLECFAEAILMITHCLGFYEELK